MKGFIAKSVTSVCLAGGVLGVAGGCHVYRNLVDPCYPQRYEYASRVELNQAFTPQVQNGHILDQTIWNYHFKAGTAELTAGGLDRLGYLARRRPTPDTTIYVQVAQDLTYDPKNPDKFPDIRTKLDSDRQQAIQTYLTGLTSGRNLTFNVVMHDPADVGMSGTESATVLRTHFAGASGYPLVKPSAKGGGAGGGGGGGAATPTPGT